MATFRPRGMLISAVTRHCQRQNHAIELLEGAGVMFENSLTDVELWDADDAIEVLDRIPSDPIRDAISQLQQTR